MPVSAGLTLGAGLVSVRQAVRISPKPQLVVVQTSCVTTGTKPGSVFAAGSCPACAAPPSNANRPVSDRAVADRAKGLLAERVLSLGERRGLAVDAVARAHGFSGAVAGLGQLEGAGVL